jgi:hypothetical protein
MEPPVSEVVELGTRRLEEEEYGRGMISRTDVMFPGFCTNFTANSHYGTSTGVGWDDPLQILKHKGEQVISALKIEISIFIMLSNPSMKELKLFFPLEIFLVSAIALAVVVRVLNLSSQEFWYDEVLSLLISGGQKIAYRTPGDLRSHLLARP